MMKFGKCFKIHLAVVVLTLLCSSVSWAGPFTPDAYTLALWHLDGDGTDFSSYNRDLTIENIHWVAGKWGQAMQTDGMTSHAYASVPYPGSGDFTIECEVRLDNTGSGWLIEQYSPHIAGHDPYVLNVTDSMFNFIVEDTPAWTQVSIPVPAEAYSSFVHIAAVYRYQSSIELFLDCDNDGYWDCYAIEPTDLVIESRNDNTWIGSAWNWQTLNCTIDEVRISNTARYIIPIPAAIDINPDTLNLNSKGKWITCYIELPEDYDVEDIDVSTIKLNDQVPAESHPTGIGDNDDDGIPDLMVKFDRAAVQQILQAGDEVEITVTGELEDETPFESKDTIRVIDKGGKK